LIITIETKKDDYCQSDPLNGQMTGEAVGVFKVIFTIDVLNEEVLQLFKGNNRG